MNIFQFFLSMGRKKGDHFNVNTNTNFQVGDSVPLFTTNPNCKNSKAQQTGVAVCVKRHADDPKYTNQPYSDPRRKQKLKPVNMGEDQYEFEVR